VRLGVDIHEADSEGNTGLHDAGYEWSWIMHDLAMKVGYTEHWEWFLKTWTWRCFLMNKFNPEIANKKGDTVQRVIQGGHGYRANEFSRQAPPKKK